MINLFKQKGVDWAGLAKNYPKVLIREITNVLTAYGRDGYFDANGNLIMPDRARAYRDNILREFAQEVRSFARESTPGAVTPAETPSYFLTGPKMMPSKDYDADMSFLDFMTSVTMDMEIESREEWDFDVQFVLMKEAGQVKYGRFGGAERSSRNDEWGAGINIKWTWFETNQFAIKMNRLAPKFRYNYYNQISDAVYGLLISTIVTPEAYDTSLIRTINNAIVTLSRSTRTFTVNKDHNEDIIETFTRPQFETASFRIIAPIELQWAFETAFAATYANNFRERLLSRISGITYTTKLTDPMDFYIVVDNWEQNEYNTRVPLEAHGPVDDIETFSQKATYRGAYGATMDALSGEVITLPEGFIIGSCCPDISGVSP